MQNYLCARHTNVRQQSNDSRAFEVIAANGSHWLCLLDDAPQPDNASPHAYAAAYLAPRNELLSALGVSGVGDLFLKEDAEPVLECIQAIQAQDATHLARRLAERPHVADPFFLWDGLDRLIDQLEDFWLRRQDSGEYRHAGENRANDALAAVQSLRQALTIDTFQSADEALQALSSAQAKFGKNHPDPEGFGIGVMVDLQKTLKRIRQR